jgi:hypothetical protein
MDKTVTTEFGLVIKIKERKGRRICEADESGGDY